MAIGKYNGDTWGANISFIHGGKELTVDVGVCLHFGETYLWAYKTDVVCPYHAAPTKMTVKVSHGNFWPFAIGGGSTISAQVCVTPHHNIWYALKQGTDDKTDKLAKDLKELSPYAEKTYWDAFKVLGEGGVSSISMDGF